MLDVTRAQLKRAALFRANSNIRIPDAIKLAAAREAGCSVLPTKDRRIPALDGICILQLSDYAR